MVTKFKHLNVPDHWEQYWSRYPQGYTIMEALINWVSQVDKMVDNVNDWNVYLEKFVKEFDKDIQGTVRDLLTEWRKNGIFDDIIAEVVLNSLINTDLTVRIPKDYPDLQSAVDDLSRRRKKQGIIITLLIEAGHTITKGLQVRHGDYGHFHILSENPVTYLSQYFKGAQPLADDRENYSFIESENSLIMGINAVMPVLACKIDMQNKYGSGYYMYNSRGIVRKGCGVINAGHRGIYCLASHLDARFTDFRGATDEGFRAQHGSTADLMGGNFDDCCKNAIGEAAIYVSKGSLVGARELTAKNSGTNGLKVRRSKVDAESSDFSGAKGLSTTVYDGFGICAEGHADISASGAKANNCDTVGLYATQLSIISGSVEAKNNKTNDIEVYHGAIVSGGNTTLTESSGLRPDIRNTNLKTINMPTGNGMITSQDQPSMMEYSTSGSGTTIKHADGTIFFISPTQSLDVSLNVGEVSAPIPPPSTPSSVLSVLHRDLRAWGRENTGAGGGRIGLDIYGRHTGATDNFRVRNSGIDPDATATNKIVKSIQYYTFIVGRWK